MRFPLVEKSYEKKCRVLFSPTPAYYSAHIFVFICPSGEVSDMRCGPRDGIMQARKWHEGESRRRALSYTGYCDPPSHTCKEYNTSIQNQRHRLGNIVYFRPRVDGITKVAELLLLFEGDASAKTSIVPRHCRAENPALAALLVIRPYLHVAIVTSRWRKRATFSLSRHHHITTLFTT
jgi:hypothetical protein